MAKNRIIQWCDFAVISHCPTCPLFYECAYGWTRKQRDKGKTPTQCKAWRRLKTTMEDA